MFGRVLGQEYLYSCCSLNHSHFFFCVPQHPGLVRIRGLGLVEAAGQQWHLDPVPVCTIKVKGKYKLWHLPVCLPGENSSSFPVIWQGSRAISFSSFPFKLCLFLCAPGQMNWFMSSALQFTAWKVGVPFVTVSPTLLLYFSMCPIFCCAETAQPAFRSLGGIVL